ncbi:sensor histidine kinase [Chryseolinea sp. T2]|uniref:sensor histidine kinase n=1 Tax=Chryseolinea sp. T2 TaxID=3129255 RepID=UPI0030782F06
MAGSPEYQVALLVAIGTVGMVFLTVAIISFMIFYQKKMLQEQVNRQRVELEHQTKVMEAVLESQELERKRVAADLHDSIGGMLSAIRMGITTMSRQLPDPLAFEPQKKMLDDTIGSVRAISRELMPSTLERFGLVHALRELCDQVHTTSLLPVNFHAHGEVDNILPGRQLMIFRIAQELVTNAVKHARATAIQMHLDITDQLVLKVEDNGIGFDPESLKHTPGRGLGLFNIENRVHLLGAKMEYTQFNSHGTRIILTAPL